MKGAERRKAAIAFADAVNSIEGAPPSPLAKRLSAQWQRGEISSDEMIHSLIEHYKILGKRT